MSNEIELEQCAPEDHDWRISPHEILLSNPPQHRIVCAICGSHSSKIIPGSGIVSNNPLDWPKA